MVEFTIVGFVLLLVTFAGIEFDRMILVYTTLSNAAHAGVRYAIVHGGKRSGSCVNYGSDSLNASGPTSNPACVIAVVQGYSATGAMNLSSLGSATNAGDPGVNVTYAGGSNAIGSVVTVTVTYPYDPFTVLPLHVNLTAQAEGRIVF